MPRTRGRKPLIDTPVEKRLSLPGSLVAEVELRFYDPLTHKVKYGAFGHLVEALLREWLQKGAPNVIPPGNDPADSPLGPEPASNAR